MESFQNVIDSLIQQSSIFFLNKHKKIFKVTESGLSQIKEELAPIWENDSEAKNCRLCSVAFTVMRRRVIYNL